MSARMTPTAALVTLAGIVVALTCAACTRAPAAPPTPAPSDDGATSTDDELPVLAYDGAPDPHAARLCHALHGAPAERRAACCEEGAAPVASDVEEQCAEVLTALVHGGNATLADGSIAACEAAQQEALSGCGWVRPLPSARPAACAQLVSGALGAGARCSSSLECQDGLRCHGASALSRGRCGAPKKDRMPCGAALDPLALALGVSEIDARHPECEGRCVLGRCAPKAAAPLASAAVPWRAASQAAPRSATRGDEGDACRNDLDCARGGCVKPLGAAPTDTGTCQMKCRAL